MQYDAILNEGFLGDVGGKGSIFFNFDILCKGFLKNTHFDILRILYILRSQNMDSHGVHVGMGEILW